MPTILVLLRKDIANFLRNRTAVSLTFFVPIALIYIFGQVFGLTKKDPGPSGIRIGVVDESGNPAAQKLIAALKAETAFKVVTTYETGDKQSHPLTAAVADERIRAGDFRFALVIPADLLPTDRIGLHLVILSDPRNEIETQMVNGLLQKTIFTSVPQLLGQSLEARAKTALGDNRFNQLNHGLATAISGAFGGDAAQIQRDIESGNLFPNVTPGKSDSAGTVSSAQDFLKRVVNIETKQVVGQNVKSPAATRVVGGWAIMFLLFAVSGSSAAFFDEKNAGLFQRLLSAPVSRAQLLWSRFTFGILLGLVQLTALFFAGSVMYGIDVASHVGLLLVICTAIAAACASFGMFIAAVSPNAQAASGLATFVVMVMSATGGAWFPISLMPEFMQKIGRLSVVYWSMEGLSQVLWAGNTFGQLLPTLGVLVGITAGVMSIAIWRLNQKKIFG
jgi:ABC-2 type transport system permease protein